MQSTETDKKPNGDDELINFRPSPNFKHMRKYLKSKFEESLNQNEVTECIDSKVNMSAVINKALEVSEEKKVKAMLQPPLPPNPPPPDSPPLIIPKKEIVNDEYEDAGVSSETQCDELTNGCKTNDEVKPEKAMCRNFIRGTCVKRQGCRFTHKLILSQLPGVYTFCKNFQNSVCSRPKCKFVHATVFEKEHFLRTGYLPQHVFKHLKEMPTTQPPLPPEGPQVFKMPQIPQAYRKPPPPAQLHVAPLPTLQPFANNTAATRNGTDIFRPTIPGNTSPKRKWNDTDELVRSPCDSDVTLPLAKKCKTCDSNEFRYQYSKNKVEKLKQSTFELEQEILQLNKKQLRLNTVFLLLFKSSMSSKSSMNVLQSSLDMNGDKDEDIMEQLNFMSGEDSDKIIMTNNLSRTNFLTLFLNASDADMPTDAI